MNTNLIKSYDVLASMYSIAEGQFKKVDVDSIVQEYQLPKKDTVRCGYCKEGNASKCNTNHQKGFVIKRLDGRYSLLGNECAKDFGENDEIRNKINKLQNKRRLEEKYGNIVNYVNDIGAYSTKLKEIKNDMEEWKSLVEKLFDSNLTAEFIRVIESGIKNGSMEVKLNGLQYECDENGQKKESKLRNKSTYTIGVLYGLVALDLNKPKNLINQVNKANSSLKSAEKIVLADAKKNDAKKITELNNQLNNIQSIYNAHDEFMNVIEVFKKNDFNIATMIFSNPQSKECFKDLCEIFALEKIVNVSQIRQKYVKEIREKENLDNVFEFH